MLSQSKNMIERFMKTLSHRAMIILQFLTPRRIEKMFNITSNYLAFFEVRHLQADYRILREVPLHVIPVRIIVP